MPGSYFRSFALLEHKRSDARILNLRHTALKHADDPEMSERPFFANAGLNRAIIIKHHLRPDELPEFNEPRVCATKVVLPIDQGSLRSGAKSFLVGQRDYDALVRHEFGFKSTDEPDLQTLQVLDEVRSFDPFLLRPELDFHGIRPAACYFELPERKLELIKRFVEKEIGPVVDAALGYGQGQGAVLGRKLISDASSSDLAPLRHALQFPDREFARMVLSWKAFIYYKYQLLQMADGLRDLRSGMSAIAPCKKGSRDDHEQIATSRTTLGRVLKYSLAEVSSAVGVYDAACKSLAQRAGAGRFKDFLLEAPDWADKLGSAVAIIDHLVSFWLYNFPVAERESLTAEELAAKFLVFEKGVSSALDLRTIA